ncbi:adenosine receptor A3-like [Diadema setosum]|uniref:adenosine receptor A3-like n=1 Tax=Diadema setosum TaxID=31175 RepID=UPI003B3BBAC5
MRIRYDFGFCCWTIAVGILVHGEHDPPTPFFTSFDATTVDIVNDIGVSTKLDAASPGDFPQNTSAGTDIGTLQLNDTQQGSSSEWVLRLEWSLVHTLDAVCSCVGTVGNMLVILALGMQVRVLKHSTDVFIGALAVADLLTSVFIVPIPVAVRVPYTPLGKFYCKFIYSSYFVWVAVHASIYTLVGMAIERTIAVVSPLHFKAIVTPRKVYIYLSMVWLLSFTTGLYQADLEIINNTCTILHPPVVRKVVVFFLLIFRFGVPVVVMITTQVVTACSLHRQFRLSQKAFHVTNAASSVHIRARNRITWMTFLIVMAYILTFAPHHIAAGIYVIKGKLFSSYLFSPLHNVLSCLTFSNSCANPFIYASQYPRFRCAIRDTFTCRCAGKGMNTPLFMVESTSSKR